MGLIVAALFLDGFQAAIMLSFTGIFGALSLVPFIGTAIEPVGIMVGFVIGTCLSATVGAGVIALLIFNGMFYPKYLLPGGINELIPGLNILPTWTAITVASVLRKNKEEREKQELSTAEVQPPPVLEQPRSMDGIQPPTAANANYAQQPKRYAA